MPASVERCVNKLKNDPKFKPKNPKQSKESAAWAVCTAAYNKSKKHSEDFGNFLCGLMDKPIVDAVFDDEKNELDIDHGSANHCHAIVDFNSYEVKFTSEDGKETAVIISAEAIGEVKAMFGEKDDGDEEKLGETRFTKEEINNDPEVLTAKYTSEHNDNISLMKRLVFEGTDEKDKNKGAIEVIRTGKFSHWLYGDLNFDSPYLKTVIKNFKNDITDRVISFDERHDAGRSTFNVSDLFLRRRKTTINGRESIHTFLIAEGELTPLGRRLMDDKSYNYFSAEIHPDYFNPETQDKHGPTLVGGGFTNRPFIRGMKKLEFSESDIVDDGVVGIVFSDDLEYAEDVMLSEFVEGRADLPDAAFALVEKDKGGKVVKRSLPHHVKGVKSGTDDGTVVIPLLRNALARINQVNGFTSSEIASAQGHLDKHADALLETRKETKKESHSEAIVNDNAKGDNEMDFEVKIKELEAKIVKLEEAAKKAPDNSDEKKAYSELLETTKTLLSDTKKREEEFSGQNEKLQKLEASNKELTTKCEEFSKTAQTLGDALKESSKKEKTVSVELFCEGLAKDNHFPAIVKVVKDILLSNVDADAEYVFHSADGDKIVENKGDVKKIIQVILDAIPADVKIKRETSEGKTHEIPSFSDPRIAAILSDEAIKKILKKQKFSVKE